MSQNWRHRPTYSADDKAKAEKVYENMTLGAFITSFQANANTLPLCSEKYWEMIKTFQYIVMTDIIYINIDSTCTTCASTTNVDGRVV